MNTLIFQIDKMGIKIVNNSSADIHVTVAKAGGDNGGDGSTSWFTLYAHGGSDQWNRDEMQVISFTKSQAPGTLVETVLGVPGTTVNIH